MAELFRVAENAAAAEAGAMVASALQRTLRDQPHARLAIPGGSAAKALPFVRKILGSEWSSVHLTWVDERCVDFEDSDSNRGTAYRSAALSEEQAPGHELPLWLDGETADSAEERVKQGLQADFGDGLDVTLLGMGADGHIASLFPGHRLLDLPEGQSVATLSDSPKPPASRLTLTRRFLETSGTSILLALGQAKESALRRVLEGDPTLPASKLRNLTIITNLDLGAVS